MIHDIKIIAREETELILSMPARKDAHGNFHDVAHPIQPWVRQQLNTIVIGSYARMRMDCDEAVYVLKASSQAKLLNELTPDDYELVM